jgi:hypothetical protein
MYSLVLLHKVKNVSELKQKGGAVEIHNGYSDGYV